MSARTLSLLVNVTGVGHHPGAWTLPGLAPDSYVDPAHHAEVARIAERGALDGLLLADIPALADGVADGPGQALEPSVLLSYLSASTERIGLVLTGSTSFNEPWNLARRVLSLDHASGGRAGWNAVATFLPEAAHNFGRDAAYEHADRYRRADEFIGIVRRLWDSWEDGALLADVAGGEFADPARIRPAGHDGEFFHVEGALNLPRSPQGRPVQVQAGASERGAALAGKWAEVVYAPLLDEAAAREYRVRLDDHTRRSERSLGSIRLLPGLVPVIGSTRAEAEARYAGLEARVRPGAGQVARAARTLGLDPDLTDPDAPLTEAQLSGPPPDRLPTGFFHALAGAARRDGLSLAQLAARSLGGHRSVVGTPEQIADDIVRWWRAGLVDGFTLVPDALPDGLETFVDHVIPLLRAQGAVRTGYEGTTLRDHLGLAHPERT
ncbi:NtaA/DmoA family FMN-dependent monooxygenase [Streptomyces sp. HNM0575]|uniref:NtaA/DmoA family FMN-dependent monooxygenase n=1 Tax=Streptomyces sp. HNM0575 TaxID=2716338 RepID=UPI00145CC0F0|nr:NtaA/DmoA family FMN-dependent monooxygenase [Streptomyces sp. HNM0575]NLU76239.1 NtaA/DmoA family FMN-dependent monooxygenase [Streptomyces sp. HNM0575]